MIVAPIKAGDSRPLPKHWDLISIGSGISSLALGAELARLAPGMRVLLIDRHHAAGGYASVFYRRKKRFDCSLHKLSGMGKGGNLKPILENFGLGGELHPVYAADYFEILAPSLAQTLSSDYEAGKDQLLGLFPEEQAALVGFFNEVETHGRNGYYQLQMLEGRFEPDFAELRFAHRHLKSITVAEALNQRFKSPLLREILAAPAIYVGGFAEDLGYLYFLHVVYATWVCGNSYIKGSSQHLSNSLGRQIEAAGGAVLLNTEVTEILVNASGQAEGVASSRGRFYAPEIIINASPHFAVSRLFPPEVKLDEVKTKLADLKPSRSTTTLYAVLDCPGEQLGLISAEMMVFSSQISGAAERRHQARSTAEPGIAEQAFWQYSTMEVTNYHLLDATGGPVICLNVLDDIDHWPERGTAEYRAKKSRAAKVLMDRLLAVKPKLAGHVRFSEISSPRTYQRYTNNTDGAGYGAMVGTNLKGHLFHRHFPVAGVLFLSAWVAGPSYEAAFGYACMKARSMSSRWHNHQLEQGALK